MKNSHNIISNEYKILFSNFISLFILQGSNYLLPLIIFPYLIHSLGIEYFGLLTLATAIVTFFRSFVAYGFDLSGTKEIAIYQHDRSKLENIFSSILSVKMILFIISLLIFLILILSINKLYEHWEIHLLTFTILLGDVLFPIWFFQGVQKMKFITYFRLSYKISFTLAVIMFVHSKEDIYLVPLLDALGAFIMGIASIMYIKKEFNISFSIPKYEDVKFHFQNSWHIFIANSAVLFYTSINTVILGMLTNNMLVGYYAVAEKIYMAIRGLFGPIVQTLFPFLSKKYILDKVEYYNLVRKISYGFIALLFLTAMLTYFMSSFLVSIVAGECTIESINVLQILSVSMVFASGGLFSGLLVIKSRGDLLSVITFKTMIFNLIFIFPAIYYFNIYGMAFLFLFVQLFHTFLQYRANSEIFEK